MELFTLPSTEEEAVKFLQAKGVFPTERRCSNSPDHGNMKLFFSDKRGTFWRCSKDPCNGNRLSVKNGTWFRNCGISLVKALRFLYSWSQELTSLKYCKEELGVNPTTAVDWNRCIRDVIAEDLDRRPCRKIGGEGLIVEVDETVIRDLKSNYGRVPPPQWIVGGICRETGQCFLKTVPERSVNAFLDVIKENVAEGSTIYCDCWKEYNPVELEAAGFQDLAASHRLNFVDPTTTEHTKAMDTIWGSLKWRHKRQRGAARQNMDSHLTEFIWRQEIGDRDPFEALLDAIKRSPVKNHCDGDPTRCNQDESNRHPYDAEGGGVEACQHHENPMDISPELCPACDMGFDTVTDLLVHAIEFHDFSGTVKQEVFPSYSAFERWKDEMEEEHNSCWLQRDEETLHMVFHGHLRCHRSRRIMKRKRKISELVLKSCTSFMDVKRYLTTGVTSVEYCLEHFGHKQLPQKPRLRWSVKMEIVEMLKLGLPIAEIVRILQNENDGTLERQYVVTVQDVKRIANKLRDDPMMFVETVESADAEEGIKAEEGLAENSMSDASIKEESETMPTSAFKVEPDSEANFMPEVFIKQEPRSATASPFRTESTPFEGCVPETSIKSEPISAATLFSGPSARFQTVLVAVQAPRNDGLPVFTLAVGPDGKGFVLANQTPCIVDRQDVS